MQENYIIACRYIQSTSLPPHLTLHPQSQFKMPKIAQIEYFRVPPRWLFVKITDDAGNVGWGEASLEGHTQAVEGCLDAYIDRYTGMDAE
jgi:GTP-dependent phosphoenolpyruvate carboxykinase